MKYILCLLFASLTIPFYGQFIVHPHTEKGYESFKDFREHTTLAGSAKHRDDNVVFPNASGELYMALSTENLKPELNGKTDTLEIIINAYNIHTTASTGTFTLTFEGDYNSDGTYDEAFGSVVINNSSKPFTIARPPLKDRIKIKLVENQTMTLKVTSSAQVQINALVFNSDIYSKVISSKRNNKKLK